MEQTGGCAFLTNHARILLALARDPARRLRDIAAACHITERTAQSIVSDLEAAGYLSRERDGRRTRYTLHLDGTLRHPAEAHLPVRDLLKLSPSTTASAEATGSTCVSLR
ncbi:helix-turn-helix transcriptional regulator [Streptomyces sp. H72]